MRGHGATGATLFAAIAGMFVLGVSGAITALGDTLTIAGGISPDENALVATFVQLRVFHPLIAFVVGGLQMVELSMAEDGLLVYSVVLAPVDRIGQQEPA